MNGEQPGVHRPEPVTIYCTQCGQAMRVAPEHLRTRVACPHCNEGLEPWRVAGVGAAPRPPIEGQPLSPPMAPRAPYGHAYGPAGPGVYSWRNRWVAGALGILLGTFGVHRFYLGFVGIGLLQCLLTVCSVFILSPVVAIWAFIEGILCFVGAMRDVDGLPLSG